MRKSLIIATLASLVVATAGESTGSAQGRGNGGGGGHGNQGAHFTGLERADASAGMHGAQGRAIARKHGANRQGFCPPGQAKKSGNGSRFQC